MLRNFYLSKLHNPRVPLKLLLSTILLRLFLLGIYAECLQTTLVSKARFGSKSICN